MGGARMGVKRCACGGEISSGGECSRCRAKRLSREAGAGLTEASRPVVTPAPAEGQPSFRYDFGTLRIQNEGRRAPAPQFATARYIDELQEYPTLDPDGAGATTADAGEAQPMDAKSGTKSCSDICDRAYKDSTLNGSGGGVVCDGATKCPCAFDVPPLTRGQCSALDENVLAHERRHLGDVDCDSSKGLHRPPFRDPSKANASECTHRKESVAELDKVLPSQTGDCKSGMQSIRDRLNTWVTANCGSK